MWAYNYLEHHGILGQKWGIRRFQNRDGTLTSEGKKRYVTAEEKSYSQAKAEYKESKRVLDENNLNRKYKGYIEKKQFQKIIRPLWLMSPLNPFLLRKKAMQKFGEARIENTLEKLGNKYEVSYNEDQERWVLEYKGVS